MADAAAHPPRESQFAPHGGTTNKGRAPLAIATGATALVVLVRFLLARRVSFCGTPDSCSYLALGESLSRHRGFVENFLYQYQMVDVRLPQHGIEYWRPGTSFLFLLAQPFGGVTLHSSLIITILAGVVLATAAWRIALHVTGDRWVGCVAYLICLVLPPIWGSGVTPDSAPFYGAAVAWFLTLFRVEFSGYLDDAMAWLCVVAVSLIRNDAVLLVIPLIVVLCLRFRRGSARGSSGMYCAGAFAAFCIAMAPMLAITHAVLGRANTSHIVESLYLTDLTELLYYRQPVTLQTALAHGLKRLITLRVSTTAMITYRFVFLMCSFGAVLFAGLKFIDRELRSRLRLELAGPIAFLLTVIAVYGLALPAIGQFSALRSFTGVLPAAAAMMALGAWGYTARRAGTLGWSFALYFAISGFMSTRREVDSMNENGNQDRAVAQFLKDHGVEPGHGSLVMSADAAQFAETTGYPTVPIPSNGPDATLEAVHDLRPTHVLLVLDPASEYADSMTALLKPVAADHVRGTRMMVLTLPPTAGQR